MLMAIGIAERQLLANEDRGLAQIYIANINLKFRF